MGEPLGDSHIINTQSTSSNFDYNRTLKPYIAFIWGFVEILFFSGIHYGWHQLLDVFKIMGVLNPAPPYFETHQYFELIFQLASAAMAIASLLLGFVLDKLGTRIYKLCGCALFTSGCVAIAFVSGSGSPGASQPSNQSSLLFLTTAGAVKIQTVYNPVKDLLLLLYGVPAIAIASTCLMLANFSVGEYFPKWRFIIIAIYSGKIVVIIIFDVYSVGLNIVISKFCFSFLSSLRVCIFFTQHRIIFISKHILITILQHRCDNDFF